MNVSHMLAEHLKTISQYSDRFGYRRTVLRLFSELPRQAGILRVAHFVALYPEFVNPTAYQPGLPYKRSMMTAREMRQYQAQLPEQLEDEFLEGAEQRGDYCYTIVDNGLLVSLGWYATDSARIMDRDLTFSPEFVYMYGGFTRPDYRGQRLHALGLAEAMTAFHQQSKSAIIGVVDLTNYRSSRSAERLGFRYFGFLVQLGSGRLGPTFVTRRARAFGVRLRHQAATESACESRSRDG